MESPRRAESGHSLERRHSCMSTAFLPIQNKSLLVGSQLTVLSVLSRYDESVIRCFSAVSSPKAESCRPACTGHAGYFFRHPDLSCNAAHHRGECMVRKRFCPVPVCGVFSGKRMVAPCRAGCTGGATVEHAVVLPLLVLLVILLLRVVILLHDQAMLQSFASESAEGLARAWRCGSNPQIWSGSGDWSPQAGKDRNLYWQLSAMLTGDAERASKAESMLKTQLREKNAMSGRGKMMLGNGMPDISVRFLTGMPFSKIRVETDMTWPVPASRLISLFGGNPVRHLHASAESLVTDPKSFIQDVDWALQLLRETKIGSAAENVCGPIRIWYGKAVQMTGARTEAE